MSQKHTAGSHPEQPGRAPVAKIKPRTPAWFPADYEPVDVEAIQALSRGEADAYQQGRALDWIITYAALTYDQPFRSDADGGERDTSFAAGRMFVGQQVVKLVNMSPKLIAELRKKHG